MKKKYEELELNLVMFAKLDVLSDSNYGDGDNTVDDPYGNI